MNEENIVSFFSENYKWIFSGVGVLAISFILKKITTSSNKVNQKNINAGGDVVGRDKK